MARVYIGTYKKYNEGSIAGKWVDLADCKSYEHFLKICRSIHKDEADPEYMIQDCEDMPDGLSCGEWLTRKEFEDIKAALAEDTPACNIIDYSEKAVAVVGDTRKFAAAFKAIGGRFNPRLTCGAGWIFSKTRIDSVRAILGSTPEAKQEAAGFVNSLAEYLETIPEKDRAYYKKSTAVALKLNGGYLTISTPAIENKFCFSDEGPEHEFYKSLRADDAKLRDYFLRENLDSFDSFVARVLDKNLTVWATVPGWRNSVELVTNQHYGWERAQREGHELTDAERAQVAAAYQFVRAAFEKRLQTYLKRYGTEKLHLWSYWVDA